MSLDQVTENRSKEAREAGNNWAKNLKVGERFKNAKQTAQELYGELNYLCVTSFIDGAHAALNDLAIEIEPKTRTIQSIKEAKH